MSRRTAGLDFKFGVNLIDLSALPTDHLLPLMFGPFPEMKDSFNINIRDLGSLTLKIQIVTQISDVCFTVFNKLHFKVVLGNGCCNRFIKAILARKKSVILADGCSVPIVRRPLCCPDDWKLPPSQRCGCSRGRLSPKIRSTDSVFVPARSIAWVFATTKRQGNMVISPTDRFFQKQILFPVKGIVHVEPDKVFRILICNMSA
ncbi:hypothetical protein BWQ96_03518 [Gracilariopsis chorda]|uniref:Uncharacterized protein n=1 Tax=Gracilariopsis chorda TaxID=448386 RepID=A0A2V3IX24_9FLOR|nr:hypothetical protein BWQ96_03518 [Gracilariopsis chorda]|eukprot:PXF46692.1 hypothetical protein BWQ96_03518 [Gracilariopsis chorda]